jgi:uncharacterized membrane protein YkoI
MNDFHTPADRDPVNDPCDWVAPGDDATRTRPGYDAPPEMAAPDAGKRRKSLALKIALVGAGVAAGAVAATALGASAQTESGSPASVAAAAATTPSAQPGTPGGDHDHGAGGGHGGEQPLSTALTAKLKAAALKAVPGATVDRVETDSGDATYEAHMTKSNGTKVTVKFDKTGKVTAVEAGMGK